MYSVKTLLLEPNQSNNRGKWRTMEVWCFNIKASMDYLDYTLWEKINWIKPTSIHFSFASMFMFTTNSWTSWPRNAFLLSSICCQLLIIMRMDRFQNKKMNKGTRTSYTWPFAYVLSNNDKELWEQKLEKSAFVPLDLSSLCKQAAPLQQKLYEKRSLNSQNKSILTNAVEKVISWRNQQDNMSDIKFIFYQHNINNLHYMLSVIVNPWVVYSIKEEHSESVINKDDPPLYVFFILTVVQERRQQGRIQYH